MFIDQEILDQCGSTQERLKEIFTAKGVGPEETDLTDEEKKKRNDDYEIRCRFEKLIGNRLMENINFSLRNHDIYSSVDLAWDSTPINKTTYPLMLYAQGKLDLGGCATALCALPQSDRYVTKNDKGMVTAINLPKFLDVNVNLIRSFITRRLAAQSNKYNNLYPHYKYESRSTSLVGKLRADIMSQVADIMADQFDYKHHEVQVYRDTFLYARSIDFMRCSWETEKQWIQDHSDEAMEIVREDGKAEIKKKSVTVREGVSFINPHPTRTFWDNAYPLSSINTDTGCEYMGYWDVVRYRDVEDNPMYWNRSNISFSSNIVTLFSTYASYFTQYYCTIKPPTLQIDLSALNDRKNNIGIYAGNMADTSLILANYFCKIEPVKWGIGSYPYPVWLRIVVAGENTAIYAEFMPTCPGCYCGLNENDNRQINISVAHELMSYQDQMTNLQSYLMQCIRADNIKVLVIDTDTATPEAIKLFRAQITGRDYNSATTVLEVSRSKLEELKMSPERVVSLVETKSTAIDVIFRAMIQLLQMVERLMALSPQEQGQPAPREISATETNLIAGTTESVYAFISDAFDEYRAAKKRLLYNAYLARGNQNFRVPVESRYTKKTIEAAGFEVVEGDEETLLGTEFEARRHTIIGSKNGLIHDYIFTSRDGAERPSNSQAAQTMVQLLSILQAPALVEAVGKEKLYEIVNEIFRLSGSGTDLKLEVEEDETNQMGVDRFQQIEKILENLIALVSQNQKDVADIKSQLQGAQQAAPPVAA